MLASAESEAVEGNECWENDTGIALQLDRENTELPARARLTGNRCHGNTQSGIVLASAESEAVEGNECWENGASGIALQLDPKNTELPARARLTGNRCHGNTQSGIMLASAESEAVEGNECWENGTSGIALQLDPKNPALPARVRLTGNRCHGNDRGYACVITAEVDALENAAFGNTEPSVFFGPDGRILRSLDWLLTDPNEPPSQTRASIRERVLGGELAAKLETSGLREPDRLARFLAGSGSLHDLRRWLGIRVRPEPSSADGSPLPDQGLYTLLAEQEAADASGERRHRFARTAGDGPARAVWDAVRRHVLRDRPCATLIATTGKQRAAIEALLADLAQVNGVDVDSADRGSIPSGDRELVRTMGINGHRIARPVVLDNFGRSEAALTGARATFGFLEPARPAGRRLWSARLGCLLRSPATLAGIVAIAAVFFAIAVTVGWIKGFGAPLHDPLGAARYAIVENFEGLELIDWFGLPTLALGALGILVAFLNKRLPAHLVLHLPARLKRGGEKRSNGGLTRGNAWKLWVRQRVWRGGRIGVIVLRDLSEWSADDRDALHELLTMRGPPESLVLLIETPSRGIVDRTVLRALMPATEGLAQARFDTVQVVLGPEPQFLDADAQETVPPVDPLLGLDPADSMARERALATVRDEAFGLADILPTLVIGSTHHFPAGLRLPMTESGARIDPDFTARLTELARLHTGADDAVQVEPSPDGVERWLAAANRATTVLLTERRDGRRSHYEILGRSTMRVPMAASLRLAFDGRGVGDAERSDYLRAALRCGEAHALEAVRGALVPAESRPIRPNMALAALRSALRLANEHDRLGPVATDRDRGRAAMVATPRLSAVAAIDSVRSEQIDHGWALAALYAARSRLAVLIDNGDDREGGAAVAEGGGLGYEVGSARAAYEALVEDALAGFVDLDRAHARSRAETMLLPLLAELAPGPAKALRSRIERHARRGQQLAAFIDASTSADDVLGVLGRHAAIGPDSVATLLATATRMADTEAARLRLVETVSAVEEALRDRLAGGRPRGVMRGGSISFDDLLGALGAIATLPETRCAGAFMATELMYASTEPVGGTAQAPETMAFGDSVWTSYTFGTVETRQATDARYSAGRVQ